PAPQISTVPLHDALPISALTRARSDAYAESAQRKYAAALEAGQIGPHLVPIAVSDPDRGWGLATADEPPRPGTTVAGMADLPTPDRKSTRLNSSHVSISS